MYFLLVDDSDPKDGCYKRQHRPEGLVASMVVVITIVHDAGLDGMDGLPMDSNALPSFFSGAQPDVPRVASPDSYASSKGSRGRGSGLQSAHSYRWPRKVRSV